jgi:hypothetical protein
VIPHNEIMIGPRALDILRQEMRGEVYSVYRDSFYCLFPGRQVLLLHAAAYGVIPFGVAVPGLRNFLAERRLTKGMGVLCRDLQLQVPELELTLSLGEFGQSPGSADEHGALASEAVILEHVRDAAAFLREKAGTKGLAGLVDVIDDLFAGAVSDKVAALNPFCRISYKRLSSLFSGMSGDDRQTITSSLDGLMGLGVGLTPSMDDVLVGLLCSLHYMKQHTPYTVKGLACLQETIASRSHLKTSLISAAYLTSAARGESYTIIDDVVRALLGDSSRTDLDGPFSRLLTVGSSSGAEMLLGIVLAFRLVFGPAHP